MKVDLGEMYGHKISFVVSDVPRIIVDNNIFRIGPKWPLGYEYYLTELYIDDKLIDNGPNGDYFFSDFGYYSNGKESEFCLCICDLIDNELAKIFNIDEMITFALPKEIEEYFLKVLKPKGEKLLKASQDEIIERDKLILDDTLIHISYHRSHNYLLSTEILPESKLLSEIQERLNNNRNYFDIKVFSDFEIDFDWDDFSTTKNYLMPYGELKKLLKIIDKEIANKIEYLEHL